MIAIETYKKISSSLGLDAIKCLECSIEIRPEMMKGKFAANYVDDKFTFDCLCGAPHTIIASAFVPNLATIYLHIGGPLFSFACDKTTYCKNALGKKEKITLNGFVPWKKFHKLVNYQ